MVPDRADATVMRMLAAHVPVTLLIDLMRPPAAEEIYVVERGRADGLSSL
jgi:hypothetical protein